MLRDHMWSDFFGENDETFVTKGTGFRGYDPEMLGKLQQRLLIEKKEEISMHWNRGSIGRLVSRVLHENV